MTKLVVVLISKNQAWNITCLIESVLQETTGVSPAEVVLVDSASTDDTIALASHYPISILRLWPNQPLTPAAGRYVGYKHTAGDFVLFLDGDMELCQGWLEMALRVMQEKPEVAAVTGQIVDLPKSAGPSDKPSLEKMGMAEMTEVPFASGAAIYRRSVLEQVGSFNPYLCSDEEPELCLGIRLAGYRILQLEVPIVYHYSNPCEALTTLVGRWRRNLYLGTGQIMRYHLGDAVFWPYLKERGYGCVPALGLAAGLIGFLWYLKTQQWLWLGLWMLLLGVIIAKDSYQKRGLHRTVFSLLHRLLIVDGTIRGFLSKPLDPSSYPGRLEVIQLVRQQG